MSWVMVVITGLVGLSITRAVGRTFSSVVVSALLISIWAAH